MKLIDNVYQSICAIVQARFELTYFFFSSRRRHTRSDRDWSSDVCSSDLPQPDGGQEPQGYVEGVQQPALRSEERRVGKSVDLGGRRIIKKKKKKSRQSSSRRP